MDGTAEPGDITRDISLRIWHEKFRTKMLAQKNRANAGLQRYMFEHTNMRSSRVAALLLLRLSENAMPTLEKRRSTAAELAGHPRYWRGPRA